MEVFEWFKTHVIDKKPDPSINHRELARESSQTRHPDMILHITVSGESNLDQALCIIGTGRGGFRVDGGKWEGRKQTNKSGSLNTKNGTRE